MVGLIATAILLAAPLPTEAGRWPFRQQIGGPRAFPRNGSVAAPQSDYTDSWLVGGAGLSSQCTNATYTTTGGQTLAITRATTKYCAKSDGTLVLLSANKVAVEADGLLVEGSRTNLVLRSQEFDNAAWSSDSHAVVTPNNVVAPDGTMTADTVTLVAGATAGQAYRYQALANESSGTKYTRSVYVKAGTVQYVGLVGPYSAGSVYSIFTLSGAGSVANSGGAIGQIDRLGSTAWYRIQTRITAASNTTSFLTLSIGDTAVHAIPFNAWTAAGTESVVFWGAQMEVGLTASSQIPTTTTAVASSPDLVSTVPTPSISAVGCVAVTFLSTADSDAARLVGTSTAVAPIILGLSIDVPQNVGGFWFDVSHKALASTTNRTGLSTVARSYWVSGGLIGADFNGVTATPDTNTGLDLSTIYLGSSASDFWFFGHLKDIKWGQSTTGCTL